MKVLDLKTQELPSRQYFLGLGPEAEKMREYARAHCFFNGYSENTYQDMLAKVEEGFNFSKYMSQNSELFPGQNQFDIDLKQKIHGLHFLISRIEINERDEDGGEVKNFHCSTGSIIYNELGLIGFTTFIILGKNRLNVIYRVNEGLFEISHPGERVILKSVPMMFPLIGKAFEQIIEEFIKRHYSKISGTYDKFVSELDKELLDLLEWVGLENKDGQFNSNQFTVYLKEVKQVNETHRNIGIKAKYYFQTTGSYVVDLALHINTGTGEKTWSYLLESLQGPNYVSNFLNSVFKYMAVYELSELKRISQKKT
jgi:hypothetical protein